MSQKNFTVDGGLEVYGGAVFNSDVNLNNNKIINVGTPENAGDLVNKAYVDAITGNTGASNPLSWTSIADKPTTIAGFGITDAFSGSWNDLTDVPDGVGGTIDWLNITNKPTFFSGRYVDLTGLPFIPTDINQLTDANSLLSVDTSAVVSKAGDTMTGTLNITGVANAIVADNDIRAGSFLITGIGGVQTDGATDAVVFANNNLRLRAGGDQAANEALNINGTTGAVTISGLRYPTTDGTNGQILATNGSGVLTWITNSGGTGTSYTDADVATFLNGNLNGPIIPDTNEAYDLGSAMYKFRDLYLSGNTIHLGETRMSRDDTTGDVRIAGADNKLRSVRVKTIEIEDDSIDTTHRTIMRKINGRMRFVDVNRTTGAETILDEASGTGGSADPATVSTAGLVKGYQDDPTGATYYGEQSGINVPATGVNFNTLIGYRNGPNLDEGSNTLVGAIIGRNATTATQNSALGFTSLYQLTTGDRNSAFGANAGYNVTTGSDNTFFGRSAGGALATGTYNTFVGNNTGSGQGHRNTVVGGQSFDLSTNTADQNVIIGMGTARNLNTGQDNTIIGYGTGTTLTDGSRNLIVGSAAEPSSATSSYEITLGSDAMTRLRIPGVGLDTADAVDGKVLGWTGGAFAWVDAPTGTGGSASAATPTTAGTLYGTLGNSTDENVTLGLNAGLNLTGHDNVMIGYAAGRDAVEAHQNVYIGRRVAISNTDGDYNTYIGHLVGYNTTTASHNTAVGHNAGLNNTVGVANAFFGGNAGAGIVDGSYNTAIGRDSMSQAACNDSAENTVLGHSAGRELNGNRNTAIGHFALGRLTTGGNDNVALGKDAGAWHTSGDRNMFLGKAAGRLQTSGFNNMIIGQESDGIDGAQNMIYFGNASHNRLVIPGLGLDTNDAADGDCLIWNDSTGEFVWGNPVTGSTGNLETSDLVVSGTLSITTEKSFQVNSATNKVWNVSDSGKDVLAGVFSKNYHDHARFLINYSSVVQEELSLTDWTTWTSVDIEQDLFAGHQFYTNKLVADVSNNIAGTRWTFQGNMLSYSYINNLILGTRYSVEPRYYDVLVESSADGVTWTTRHESTGNNLRAAVGVYGMSSIGGASWLRVTIKLTNDATNDFTKDLEIRLGNVQLMSPRPGDQGSGAELEFPYKWDGNRIVKFQNDIIMENGGQILAEGNPTDGDNLPTAPAYSFNSDSDSGMYMESWDILGFATGGQRRMKVSSSGAFVTYDDGVTWNKLTDSAGTASSEYEFNRLRVNSNSDISSGSHGLQIGTNNNYNMRLDNNEIAVYGSDGNPHNLILQKTGGNLQMYSGTGNSADTLQFQPGRIQIGGSNVVTVADGALTNTNNVYRSDFALSKTSGAAVFYMDSGSNDSARIYVDGGSMYLQVAAADTGRSTGGGNLKLTGYNGTGLASATLNLAGVGDGHILTHTNIGNYNIDADTLNGQSASDFVSTASPKVDFNRNIIKNAVLSATPESSMVVNPGFHNDWAFARLRGATITYQGNGVAETNGGVDKFFDAQASTWQLTPGATEADAIVITGTNMPKSLQYDQWVGISFGAHWNRCRGVKIETYSSQHDTWQEQFYTTTNDSEIITANCATYYQADGVTKYGGAKNTNGIRITLWDPAPGSYTRVANIFAWDFNATLGTSMYVDRSGGTVYGNIAQTSDVRVKTDIVTIENALDKVNAIRGVTFTNTITGATNQIGVIAQEVETVLPELVYTDEESGQKSVAYANTVAVLIEAVKELTAKNADLEARLKALEDK